MTDQNMNIAIAEACGWKWYRTHRTTGKPHRSLYHPELSREYIATLQPADMTEPKCSNEFIMREGMIPNYCNDLNAMHDVWASFDFEQKMEFAFELRQVVRNKWDRDHEAFKSMFVDEPPQVQLAETANASAHQRAEAFLKVVGKWKE